MRDRMREVYALDRLSQGRTGVHRLHPAAKLLATIVFIVTVVSFDRYAFLRLIPYVFYPSVLAALSETPYAPLLKRAALALPFCLFAGLVNTVADRAPAFAVGGVAVSLGVVSLCTILLRVYLCVMAVLLLVSVTPLSELTGAMRRLKAPRVLVAVFEMTYRYIGVLFEEAYSMYVAYTLRGAQAKGIRMRDMGGFVGQLLLRSLDRAENVYNAMKCRGYADGRARGRDGARLGRKDWAFLAVTGLLCLLFRVLDPVALLAGSFGGRA